ncbi:nuclear transport factor 2 family protein [Hyphomonas sp.]|uniref:YybH family protein n=1 Tax=Hyphomonas sp. TaxID=87 RepID=UPI0025C5DE14|nr:nuclear transport factor 2 family protein [Hyphomonas sp.]MBI1400640.1 DUF4440 domain-containing protein [Hyphomonas sp.]
MVRSFLAGVALMLMAACATAPAALTPENQAAEAAAITALLDAQDAAWNAGDIDGFMKGYWRSPHLRFASGGNVTRGFDQTLQRYKITYASRELMGTLHTTDNEVVVLSPDAAVVHGRWRLERGGDAPSGLYTLIFRKIGGEWLIVSDTTTSAD